MCNLPASHPQLDTVWRGATVAQPGGRLLTDTAVGVADGVIRFVGALDELPAAMVDAVAQVVECEGALLTPGLIDAHTHLVYGGSRANEFEQRLSGVSYEAIARAGGGIRATVRATRDASEDQLVALARPRLAALMREGVTTVEIKSGYGLSTEHEVRMLRAAKRLAVEGINVVTTCLAAHAVPPEFDGNADGYIDYVCEDTLPAAAPYADAADAFCEGIAFSVAQVARYFDAATALGLPLRLHAEQLSDLGGAAMAAERGALSVDHLEYLSERGVAALAKHGTVATVLPGAFYTLRETQAPPVAALREAGVPMAVATDSNPGTSPVTSLLTTMNMACTLFGMTPTEAFDGVTCHAARALGRADTLGQIAPGFRADLVLWNAERPVDLCYPIGLNPCDRVWFGGVLRASEVVS